MKQGKVTAIVQAHMSSSRLPGKILKDLCGEPALYRMFERLRHCKHLDEIVLATTTMECDDIIVEHCEKWGVKTFRGSNDDVLARYYGAAQQYPSEYYVRLTSDCPLIDPGVVDSMIEFFLDHDYKYVATKVDPNGHRNLANGMDCEVFTAELLEEAYHKATLTYEREHVTPYMYLTNESRGTLPYERDESAYRLTLDTPEDYEVIRLVYDALYQPGNHFTLDDMIAYLDAHPEILEINSTVKQKELGE